MIGALAVFLVLFGLVKLVEKDRDDLDNFQIATVAVVPVLSVILVRVLLGIFLPDPILMLVLPALVFVGLTFFLLWKNLEISLGKSIAFTVIVLVVNESLSLLLG